MEKATFIIPNSNSSNANIDENEIKNIYKNEMLNTTKLTNTNTNTNTQSTTNKKNITHYTKIAPNVYTFIVDENIYSNNDIYILYNHACQVKKENKFKAIMMFKKCVELINDKTKKEIIYEIFVNLALLTSETNGQINDISYYYVKAISIFSDRAEPYFYWSIYCNKIRYFEKSYELLSNALSFSYDDVKQKYPDTQFTAYGKHLYYELSVSCYHLKKYDEGKLLLEKIIDDPDFSNIKEIIQNLLANMSEMLNKNVE
jgi:tetratricopeptide (TPR) repeat protein